MACDTVHIWGCSVGATGLTLYVDSAGMVERLGIRRDHHHCACRLNVRRCSRGKEDRVRSYRRPRTVVGASTVGR